MSGMDFAPAQPGRLLRIIYGIALYACQGYFFSALQHILSLSLSFFSYFLSLSSPSLVDLPHNLHISSRSSRQPFSVPPLSIGRRILFRRVSRNKWGNGDKMRDTRSER